VLRQAKSGSDANAADVRELLAEMISQHNPCGVYWGHWEDLGERFRQECRGAADALLAALEQAGLKLQAFDASLADQKEPS
jgi:hypothetical protein